MGRARKNSVVALLAVLLFGMAGVAQGTVVLRIDSIPDQLPGNTFSVPVLVSISDPVLTFDFVLCFDNSAAQFVDMDLEGSIIPTDWRVTHNLISPGQVEVVGFGRDSSNAFSGSGTLVTFTFRVRDDAEWNNCYDLYFDSEPCCNPEFDGQPVETIDSQFCIPSPPETVVQGRVVTSTSCQEVGVGGVMVDLYPADCTNCGPADAIATATTDQSGYYSFHIDTSGDYRVAMTPTCYEGNDLSGFGLVDRINIEDLRYLERFLVNLENLNSCPFDCDGVTIYPQMVTADVNFDDCVNVQDAPIEWQLISNIAAPNYTGMPATTWCWLPSCGSEEEFHVDVPAPGETTPPLMLSTWTIVLPGDIDMVSPETVGKSVTVLRGPREYGVDSGVRATVSLDEAVSFHSGQFVMHYDPDVIAISDIRLSDDLDGSLLYVTPSAPGEVIVGVIVPDHDITAASLDLITFQATLISEDPDAGSRIAFDSVFFNGGYSSVRDGIITRQALANEDRTWGAVKDMYR